MISYLKAESYRFTKKKSFLMMLGAFSLMFLGFTGFYRDVEGFATNFTSILITMSPVLISIAIFIMVYTDDIGAHAVQTSVGHGFPRWLYVISKLVEIIILHVLVFAYVLLHVVLINAVFKSGVNLSLFKLDILASILSTLTFSSIAGLIALKTQKSALSVTALVLMFLGFADQILKLVYLIPFINQTFPKVVEYLPTELMMSIASNTNVTSSSWILVGYTCVITVISILVFKKAELEF